MATAVWVKHHRKPLRWILLGMLFVLLAVIAILLLTLASGSPMPEGWMLSTGPLP